MVSLLQSLPLYVVYFGLPRFALPTRSRCPSTARQLESSVFCKNGCMSFLHTKQTKETKNLAVRPFRVPCRIQAGFLRPGGFDFGEVIQRMLS